MSKRAVLLWFLGLGVVALASAPAFGRGIDIRITAAADDFEESLTNGGAMDSGSSDLEIPYENAGTPTGNNDQVVGLRFTPVPIAKGAQVTKAYIELEMDEAKGNTQVVNVIIQGELIANAPAFTTTAKNITTRTTTKAQVKWTIPLNLAVDTKFQTPDITSIINEIMSQDGWASGNAIVITIRDDKSNPSAGVRCVEAVEGEPTAAARLHLDILDPAATAPDPANGAVGVSTPLFGWTKGDGALLHNVYFGSTKDLTEANLVAKNQPFAMYFHVPGIEPGLTYYWRVDEIDAAGKVTAGPVWSFTAASQKAYEPSPKNGGRNVAVDAKLNWASGYGAQSHTVYFGTSFDDVNNASGKPSQPAPTYTPTSPLAKGTKYYWRVDEFDGKKTYKGDVWSFTTIPDIKITNPDLVGWWPLDEGTGTKVLDFSGYGNDGTLAGGTKWVDGFLGNAVDLSNGYIVIDGIANDVKSTNLTLSAWIKTTQAGEGNLFALNDAASAHPLLFGISGGTVYVNDGSDTMFPPTMVNDGKWHMVTYVRSGGTGYLYVDGVQVGTYSATFSLSTVTRWSIGQEWDDSTPSDFYIGQVDDVRIYNKDLTTDQVKELMRGDPLVAWKPSPDNKTTMDVIRAEQGLTWAPGDNAKQHDVYFGKDQAAVAAANASDKTGLYRGRQAGASYTPTEELAWGTGPYYWRVDEVQADGTVSTGAVWSFSIANFLSVDDMESYTDNEGSRIFDIWLDGWVNNTGALVGNLTAPFAEQTIVHGGRQAMPLDFDNSKKPFYSEAELDFAPVQNWTNYGVDTLSLWVQGRPLAFVDKGSEAFTVSGSGHDIWDAADDFRFVYKRLSGDASIAVKVDSLVNTNTWAKAGVMIRQTLDDTAPMAYMIISFSSGASFGWRQIPAGTPGSATTAGIAAPQWVKLTRTGNVFTAQFSADGKTWTDIKNTDGTVTKTTVNMTGSIYIGLCVTSHTATATTTAQLSGAATTGGVTGAWQQVWIGDDPDRTNGAASLYVAVEDSTGKSAVVSDPALANSNAWTEWKVPLSKFTGVNLAKIKKLYLGVGDRKQAVADGSGRVYIDDIRLTKP